MKFNHVVVCGGATLLVLPFLFSSLGASSWMLGTLIGAVLTLSIACLKGARIRFNINILAPLIALLVFNITGTSLYYEQIPALVQTGAALIAVLLLIFSETLGYYLASLSEVKLRSYITRLIVILLTFSAIAMAIDARILPNYSKSILYFIEPSHFALAISPFVLYVTLNSGLVVSTCISLLLLLQSIVLENTTLLVVFLFTALFLILRVVRSLYIRICCSLLLVVAISVTLLSQDYFMQRVTLSRSNVSSLVYLRGLEAAEFALTHPPFIGVGFQMMGSRAPLTLAVELLEQAKLETQNANDGGFIAAKIVTEFGWIGFLSLIYLIAVMGPVILSRLLIASQGTGTKDDYIFIACSSSVVIQLFIRGSGYLGPFLILIYLSYGFMPVTGWLRETLGNRVLSGPQ